MSTVIELLREKNELLEKFYHLNQNEMFNLSEGNFENLDDFYNSREVILALVRKIDQRIEDTSSGFLTPEELTSAQKASVLKLMDTKSEIVHRILSQDLQILSLIENEKSIVIKELRQTQIGKKAMGSYQSESKKRPRIDEVG